MKYEKKDAATNWIAASSVYFAALAAAVSAFKFFTGSIAGGYGFHLGSVGRNSNFSGRAGFCVVVFAFFHVADQIFH